MLYMQIETSQENDHNSLEMWVLLLAGKILIKLLFYEYVLLWIGEDKLLLRFIEVVSNIKNFLPGDPAGVARM